MGGVVPVAANPALDGGDPLFGHGVGVALVILIGVGLAAQGHQHITVENRCNDFAQQRHSQRQAAALFQTGEVQRRDRDIAVARLDEGLAQQLDVVGRAAAAAGLGDEQRRVVQVVLAAVQRVQELADDQKRRVTGVVMDVFQAQLGDLAAAVAQHLGLVALAGQRRLHEPELGDRHVGNQDFMGLYHILGKIGSHVFHGLPLTYGLLSVLPVLQTGCAGECSPRPGS